MFSRKNFLTYTLNTVGNVKEMNGGKPVMSEKGKWYQDRRKAGPKSGSRAYLPGDKDKQDEGYSRIFGTPTCTVCKVEVLRGRATCDSCSTEL